MRKVLGIAIVCAIAASSGYAAPPELLNYQGRLVDNQGELVNGTVDVDVRLFTVESGGTPEWSQSITNVEVYRGLYKVEFGGPGLSDVLTNAAVWLEVSVDNQVLSPRNRLASVPYALRAAVANTLDEVPAAYPPGIILIWSGALNAIPEGWALCDGSNGSPDLRERFVMGAPTGEDPGAQGGTNSFALALNQMPAHTHSATAANAGAHTHSASTGTAGNHGHGGWTGGGGGHNHSITADNSMGSSTARPGGGVGGGLGNPWGYVNDVGHAHGVNNLSSAGSHTHGVTVNAAGDHTHTVSVGSTGSGALIDNRPAFYAAAYIYKL